MNFIKFKPFEYKEHVFEDGDEVGEYANKIWSDSYDTHDYSEWETFRQAITLYIFDYFKARTEDESGEIMDDDNLTRTIKYFMTEVYEDFICAEKYDSELTDYDLEDRWDEHIYIFKDPREEEVYYKLLVHSDYYDGWQIDGISRAEKKTKTVTYFE
jgi:hypothetical protein